MIKNILTSTVLLLSSYSYGYEDTFYKVIQTSESDKILIDVISHDKNNINRHFEFAKKIINDFPDKDFRFGFHKHATFYTLKNDVFEKQRDILKKHDSKYIIDFEKNDFSIIQDLNGEFYACKAGAKKRLIDLNDINPIFNTKYTSGEINKLSKKDGYLILKEKFAPDIKKLMERDKYD